MASVYFSGYNFVASKSSLTEAFARESRVQITFTDSTLEDAPKMNPCINLSPFASLLCFYSNLPVILVICSVS